MEDRSDRKSGNERAKADIGEIIHRLARAVDRMDWNVFIALSAPDAVYDYGGFRGDAAALIGWMSERHKKVFRSTHLLGNMIIEFADGAALAETYVHAIQEVPSANDPAQHVNILSYARYVDEFRPISGGWRLKSRYALIDNQLTLPAPPGSPAGLRLGRRDRDDMLWSERARLGMVEP